MKISPKYRVDGVYIRDSEGRYVILRGCNLGGNSKLPLTPSSTDLGRDVSFVGRPFPESEADIHFARLAGWGFTFLRFVITWEAVEHSGPGIYDEDYLSYVRTILKKAEAHGISVFIDPHQDVWSRWTGGDGAPVWTLEAIGFDIDLITKTGAAFTLEAEGARYKEMSWGLNYLWYANATMWTLFFAGNTYAPGRMIEGCSAQNWLQDHFIAAMKHTARRLKDCAAVVGFGTLNEPHYGYIGLESLNGHQRITAPAGSVPSAFQGMAAASGFPQKVKQVCLVGKITLPKKAVLNPEGLSLFKDGFMCPWREAGVWDVENGHPVVKKPKWFVGRGFEPSPKPVDFGEDFLKPFQQKFMWAVSKKHEHYIFFIEGIPHGGQVRWTNEDKLRPDGRPLSIVEAFHWYDGLTHIFKKWRSWLCADSETEALSIGPGASRRSIFNQIARMATRTRTAGFAPFLGEFGIQFDSKNAASKRTGVFSAQEEALGTYYDAIDASLLSSTIWHYSATHSEEAGDGWNTEDLSVYSATTKEGRALKGFCRPYAMAISGIPARMKFDTKKRVFSLEWDAVSGVTEIYVPSVWFPEGWRSSFEGGSAELEEKPEAQRLYVHVVDPASVKVTVCPLKKGDW